MRRKLGESELARGNTEAAIEELRRALELDPDDTAALFKLGETHFRFAARQPKAHWRQKISRFYYAAYNVTRALRLHVAGEYSTDVKDHQRIERLPDDFPSKERFANQLKALREDRNLCDYDHTKRAADLVLGTNQSASLVTEFLNEAREYLKRRGLGV